MSNLKYILKLAYTIASKYPQFVLYTKIKVGCFK